jgi:hypothetical protein
VTWAFKDIKGLRRSQLVQTSKERVEVHMDMEENGFSAARATVAQRLDKMFFGEIAVHCVLDKAIQITSAGKTRFVVVER